MDPLSHILALLRPREVGWRLIEGRGGWTLHLPPRRDIVVFGHLLEGAVEVRREHEPALATAAGDFILIASPRPWSMRAPGSGPEVGLKTLFADPSLLMHGAAPQHVTRFVGGYFAFDPVGADLIGDSCRRSCTSRRRLTPRADWTRWRRCWARRLKRSAPAALTCWSACWS